MTDWKNGEKENAVGSGLGGREAAVGSWGWRVGALPWTWKDGGSYSLCISSLSHTHTKAGEEVKTLSLPTLYFKSSQIIDHSHFHSVALSWFSVPASKAWLIRTMTKRVRLLHIKVVSHNSRRRGGGQEVEQTETDRHIWGCLIHNVYRW